MTSKEITLVVGSKLSHKFSNGGESVVEVISTEGLCKDAAGRIHKSLSAAGKVAMSESGTCTVPFDKITCDGYAFYGLKRGASNDGSPRVSRRTVDLVASGASLAEAVKAALVAGSLDPEAVDVICKALQAAKDQAVMDRKAARIDAARKALDAARKAQEEAQAILDA